MSSLNRGGSTAGWFWHRWPVSASAVRPIRSADHSALRALAPRLAEGVAEWRDHDAVDRSVRAWVEEALQAAGDSGVDGRATEGRAVLVAEVDGRVAGFVTLGTRAHFTGEIDAYVGELVVAAAAQSRGVGRSLVVAAEAWARERGLSRITLETGAANSAARAFYAALGFAEEDVRLTRTLP